MHTTDGKIALVSGFIGGFAKYLAQINTPFLFNMIGAMVTALLCGICGVAGKEIYLWIKKRIKQK